MCGQAGHWFMANYACWNDCLREGMRSFINASSFSSTATKHVHAACTSCKFMFLVEPFDNEALKRLL